MLRNTCRCPLPSARTRTRNSIAAIADAIEVIFRDHPDGLSASERWIGPLHAHTLARTCALLSEGAAIRRVPFVPVRPGSCFSVAGFEVRVHGGRHAAVVPGQAACLNVGFHVGGLYHPGDSLDVPGEEVETLLVPMQASWLKTAEAIAFCELVAPRRAFGIHDGQINERAIGSVNGWLGQRSEYEWMAPGADVELS